MKILRAVRTAWAEALREIGRIHIRGAECAYRAELYEERRYRESLEQKLNECEARNR